MVRAALISLAGQPRDADSGLSPQIAGRALALRQLDFALAAGAESIIALGDGASPDAIALRHRAERAGARFQAIRGGHALPAAIGPAGEVVVLAPGLLPESVAALDMVRGPACILVLPSAAAGPATGPGTARGFERIDLERAWAGAMVIPGHLIGRLAELPADAEPAAALLRIALQAQVRECRLPESVLADGAWAMVASGADAARLEAAWLARNLPRARRFLPSERAANAVLRAFGSRILAAPRGPAVLRGACAALLVGSVLLSWSGAAGAGFAVLALGVLAALLDERLSLLRAAPFGTRLGRHGPPLQRLAVDLALAIGSAGTIHGDWLHRLFAPLVLIGALRTGHVGEAERPAALLHDRAVLAVFLALAAAFDAAEPAIMVLALAAIALNALEPARRGG